MHEGMPSQDNSEFKEPKKHRGRMALGAALAMHSAVADTVNDRPHEPVDDSRNFRVEQSGPAFVDSSLPENLRAGLREALLKAGIQPTAIPEIGKDGIVPPPPMPEFEGGGGGGGMPPPPPGFEGGPSSSGEQGPDLEQLNEEISRRDTVEQGAALFLSNDTSGFNRIWESVEPETREELMVEIAFKEKDENTAKAFADFTITHLDDFYPFEGSGRDIGFLTAVIFTMQNPTLILQNLHDAPEEIQQKAFKDAPFRDILLEIAERDVRTLRIPDIARLFTAHTSDLSDEQLKEFSQYTYLSELLYRQTDPRTEELLQDPALPMAIEIAKKHIDVLHGTMPGQNDAQSAFIIARNFILRGETAVTDETIRAELDRIETLQKKYGDTALFKDREVILVAHNERKDDGSARFGKANFIDAVQHEIGQNKKLTLIKGLPDSLVEAKWDGLSAIAKADVEPITFIFDGHGLSKGLYLGGQEGTTPSLEPKKDVGISPEELAEAFVARAKKQADMHYAPTEPDIMIVSACYGSTFANHFYTAFKTFADTEGISATPPLLIGHAEEGQYGFSHYADPMGSDFLSLTILNRDGKNKFSTIGGVLRFEPHQLDANPTMFIPDELGVGRVAENETSTPRETDTA